MSILWLESTTALTFILLFVPLVGSGIVNRTIDDSFGDSQTGRLVTYLPSTSGVWKNENCFFCALNPHISQTFQESYTAATYKPNLGSINITMRFNGTAIYVFFILANAAGIGVTTLTLANFTLDQNFPQLFEHVPNPSTTDFQYNQMVFSQTDLPNTEHVLVISTTGISTQVYVNFDYAIYTYNDDFIQNPIMVSVTHTSSLTTLNPEISQTILNIPNATSSNTDVMTTSTSQSQQTATVDKVSNRPSINAAIIAGGVVGATAALVSIALVLRFYLRRKCQKIRNEDERSYMDDPHHIETLEAIPCTQSFFPIAFIYRSVQRLSSLHSAKSAANRQQTPSQGPVEAREEDINEMSNVREQLRILREQIAHIHIQVQQRPLLIHAFPDDTAPPGYTVAY